MLLFAFFRGCYRGLALVVVVTLAVASTPYRASAGWMTSLSPQTTVLAAGGSQQFTVYLTADAGTPITNVAGFTIRLELTGEVARVYLSAGAMPTSGYVFEGNSGGFGAILGPQNPGDPFPSGVPTRSLTLTDFPNDPPYTIGLSGPGSWALGVVTVTADPNATGGLVQLRFNQTYSDLEGTAAPLDLSFGPGASFQVGGTGVIAPVPEPGGLTLLASAFPFLAYWPRQRRAQRMRTRQDGAGGGTSPQFGHIQP